jgi:hypothetical protein
MQKKIIIIIVAIALVAICILSFFLVCEFLWVRLPMPLRERLIFPSAKFDMNAKTNEVMDAFKAKDIDGIESMMCKDIKDNVDVLSEKIAEMMNAVEGKIVDCHWSKNFGENKAIHYGNHVYEFTAVLHFNTETVRYRLDFTYAYSNSAFPEEEGLRMIWLWTHYESYEDYKNEFKSDAELDKFIEESNWKSSVDNWKSKFEIAASELNIWAYLQE